MTAPDPVLAVSDPLAADVFERMSELEDQVVRLERALHLERLRCEIARRRTFELSERVEKVRQDAAPLRDLLGEVLAHALGPDMNCYALPDDNIWHRARVAADGGAAVTRSGSTP